MSRWLLECMAPFDQWVKLLVIGQTLSICDLFFFPKIVLRFNISIALGKKNP